MKSIIIYYSYTGNTHRVAELIVDTLKDKNEEARPVRIRPLKEETNFFAQCIGSFLAKKPQLYRTLLDLRDFDRIIIGSPVWAFKPAPAINTFLDKCNSLAGKDTLCFVTCKGFIGRSATLNFMKRALEAKGVRSVKTVSFQDHEPAEGSREKLLKLL